MPDNRVYKIPADRENRLPHRRFGLRNVALILSAAFLVASTESKAGHDENDLPQAKTEAAEGTHVVLLGTAGGPIIRKNRSQPATLITVEGRNYLIDAGESISSQLNKAGVELTGIDRIFLTHLHGDHVIGLASLLMFNWTSGKRQTPLVTVGPPGTSRLVSAASSYVDVPADTFRQLYGSMPLTRNLFPGEEPAVGTGPEPTLVYEDDKVRVMAVENSHYSATELEQRDYGKDRAYSYRFDAADRSIVITGDTGASDNLTALAKDADVLVTEVVDLKRVTRMLEAAGLPPAVLEMQLTHMREQHISPEEIGKLAKDAGVKEIVLTHIVPGADDETDMSGYVDGIRRNFAGPVHIGRDLDRF